ncbi:hypothetical protein [Bradyrhizobium tropiciagri]|uniref:hypothetical protein n=1 Tax=Bradyrhizobium tropiciagri TaxID=312253 RepID=UPI003D319966
MKFIAASPWLGHGTGSIRHMFTLDAIGQTGLQAEVINNPHNQTFNVAIQWGLLGILLLCAMWTSHTRLFAGRDLYELAAQLAFVRFSRRLDVRDRRRRRRRHGARPVQQIRGQAKRDPGPITTNGCCCIALEPQPASTTRVCGYGSLLSLSQGRRRCVGLSAGPTASPHARPRR